MRRYGFNGSVRSVFCDGGIGGDTDSLSDLSISPYLGISEAKDKYANLYANSWQCRKVCEYHPNLMSNIWGKVILPNENKKLSNEICKYTDRLRKIYREGQIIANIYGGATAVRYVDDDKDFSEPIDLRHINELDYSALFDRWSVFPYTGAFNKDYYNPEYYQYYETYKIKHKSKGNYNKIHSDRIIRFRGKYLPPDLMEYNDYWEASILSEFLEPYARYYSAITRTLEAIKTAEVFVVGIEDLDDYDLNLTKEKQEEIQRDLVQHRLLVKNKDSIEIEVLSRKFAGLKELLDDAKKDMVASSGLTLPQLYQEFPSGFQATGKSELISEALALNNKQENKWGELIRADLELIMALLGYKGEYEWKWNNPYFSTPIEEMDIQLKQAQIDQIYHQINSNKYNNEINRSSE